MNRKVMVAFATILLSFSFVHIAAAQECGPKPRLISVTGTAEINAAPDQVSLNLGVETHDKDLSVAKSQNDARIKTVMAIARGAGVEPNDIATSALRMSPELLRRKSSQVFGL